MGRVLARDQSASLEDWQKLARTGEIVWFYNGRDRKKTDKIVRNGHFGQAVSESWLNPCLWGVVAQWLECCFKTWASLFMPHCPCLSEETLKAVGPFCLVSMPGEVKDPTQG